MANYCLSQKTTTDPELKMATGKDRPLDAGDDLQKSA